LAEHPPTMLCHVTCIDGAQHACCFRHVPETTCSHWKPFVFDYW